MKSIDESSLPLSVYGLTRSTQRASHGVLITILDGRCPYFCVLFFTWQVLHDFFLDRMVLLILSSILQISLFLRDKYARGAEDSGDTT